jgi:hypothetical protein
MSLHPFNPDGTPVKPFNEHGTQIADMQPGEYALHGDIIIERISELPAEFHTAELEPLACLGYGEATQHIHSLQGEPGVDFTVKILPTKERLLHIVRPTALKHQEHSPIILQPGYYKTGFQVEYDPYEKLKRSVID